MRKTGIVLTLPLALLFSACQPTSYEFHGSVYPDPPEAPTISLQDLDGRRYELDAQPGKPVLVYFGYTRCPDVCPATLHNMAWVFDQLGEQAANVDFLFITTDPERDSTDAIRAYLTAFDPRFQGLTGDLDSLASTALAYGVFFAKDPPTDGGYLVSHTARVFLIDPSGILRTNYPLETAREDVLADLRYLLASGGS